MTYNDWMTVPEFQQIIIAGVIAGVIAGFIMTGLGIVVKHMSQKSMRLEFEERISKIITNMFRHMEFMDEHTNKDKISEARTLFFRSQISKMRNLSELNYVCLKKGQFIEFIDSLNVMEEAIESHIRKKEIINNTIYGGWLEHFKNKNWIKIPIKKIDFKEL